MQTQIQGLSTHYIDLPGEKGTVLFLHGWGAHIGLYQNIFDLLQEQGYRVVAFDMPGVGKTQEPPKPLTVADYVAFTLELCQKLSVNEAILMCHSHGGRIALSMLTDPACPVKCQKAVFFDATGVRKAPAASRSLRQAGYKVLKWLGTSRLTAPLFDDLYAEIRDKRASADYKAATPVMRQTMNNVLPADFTDKMPSITAEVLLIWGENDTATPLEHGRIMESLIPNSGLAVIQKAGHFSHTDNWPQFSAVLRAFL